MITDQDQLLKALKDEDSYVRLIAAGSLAAISDPAVISALIASLQDSDPDVRRTAASSLGTLQAPEAIEPLLCALKDPSVHGAASRALNEFEGSDLIHSLITALENESPLVRKVAATLLGKFGSSNSVDALIKTLSDPKWTVRKAAVQSLHSFKTQSVVQVLLHMLRDKHLEVRDEAAQALEHFKDPIALPLLREALNHPEDFIREVAARSLGHIEDPLVIVYLIQTMSDTSRQVRVSAARALKKRKEPITVSALVKALKHQDQEVRILAASTLKSFESSMVVEPLSESIIDDDFYDRQEAIELLGSFKEKAVIKPLIEALGDKRSDVRQLANQALREHPPLFVVSPLIEAMSNEVFHDKTEAIELLGSFDHPVTLAPLLEALEDPNKRIQDTAIEALRSFSHPIPVPYVSRFLNSDYMPLRLLAALLLGQSKDSRAIKPLIAALEDGDPSVLAGVIKALSSFYTPEVATALGEKLEHENFEVRQATVKALEPMNTFHALTPLLNELKKWDSQEHSIPANIMVSLFKEGHRNIAYALGNAMLFYEPGNASHVNNIVQSNKALNRLVSYEEWRHLAFFVKRDASPDKILFGDFKQALNNTYLLQKKEIPHLFCTQHVSRFQKYKQNNFNYFACRICGETHHGSKARMITVVLDETMQESFLMSEEICRVNWLHMGQVYDYDNIEIGQCSDDDIKAFFIAIGNDADVFRSKRKGALPIKVQPNIVLSEEIKNILKQRGK
ncbi:MAG: HEAT repeat domain-containing protein [Rhodothermaceae bacterium]|nr:HEAT repeat domain-containing protein [Rhodothermaceae bacterium]